MKNLKLALLQIAYKGSLELQKEHIEEKIKHLSKEVVLVVLPEMSLYASENGAYTIEEKEETLEFLDALSEKYKKVIIGAAIVRDGDIVKNRAYVVYPNGVHTFYDKHQLFGQEQELICPGHKHLIIQINGWKILMQICYDLRFPEWSRMNEQTYDAILFVAAWPKKRIHAWDVLLQARAIENVSYVLAVNRTGGSYSGHSQVINPLGEVLVKEIEQESVIEYHLLHKELQEMRSEFPYLDTRDRFLILPEEE